MLINDDINESVIEINYLMIKINKSMIEINLSMVADDVINQFQSLIH